MEPKADDVPAPRRQFAADIDRTMVVAEAKILVQQLDRYLELISEWTSEETDGA